MRAAVAGVIGYPAIDVSGGADSVAKFPLGTIIDANDPYWGGGEYIYLQMPASQALLPGAVLSYDVATAFLAALVANTAIMGKAVAFALNKIASSAAAQYAWAQIAGQGPIWSNASIAANVAIGIVAAGQGGAVAAGKQLNGCRITLPATTTVVKNGCQVRNGSPIIVAPNTDGWFAGVALTGTGMAASTVINQIMPDGKTVIMNNNANADGPSNITGTYNDATNFFNIGVYNRPYIQGPIT